MYQTLEAAVTAAASGDTIVLGEGNYTLYKVNSEGHTKGKDLTFVGQGADKTGWNIGAEVPDPANFGTEYNGDYSFDGAGTVTFKNMTLRSGKADYLGFIRADNTVVEDCIINGKTFYWGYTSASFKNTTFNCPSGDYAIWTYSSPTMTFDTCTFNSSGKVINVYTDYGAGKQDITVNFENCTVNNTGKSLKPVLNINDSNMGKFKYILNISGNTTVTGVDVDKDTCSRLFGFGGKAASNNKGKTVVNFGDTTVWAGGKMVDAKAYHTDGVKVDGVTYGNGGSGANDILYAEGYKDNKVETTATDWVEQEDGSYTRTVTRKCNYCGYEEETTEIDWNVPKSIIAAACLNTKDHYSYLIGYSDGTVRPNGRITRAEVATIFFRLLTDDARQRNWSSENNFSDVSADKWYNNAVSTLCHMGVLGGYSDGTFRPNAPITRAEFAKIAVSFSQANDSAVYSYFTDVKTTDWFAPYVTAAKDSSLIEGYFDGSFKPENRITRAEACTIVNRVLGRKPSKNHMKISGRIDWPDCTTADWFYEAIMEATNSHTYQMGKRVETWNGKLPQRDWAALENNWASAYTGKGGEVH
ncbi:MAG: S-layer homology domain-containing protein [Oscillospiraceae bacterium]